MLLSGFCPGSAVDGVCTVANCVGKELAPHVKKHGSKLVPESLKKDRNGKSALDGAMVVAASSVQGDRHTGWAWSRGGRQPWLVSLTFPCICRILNRLARPGVCCQVHR